MGKNQINKKTKVTTMINSMNPIKQCLEESEESFDNSFIEYDGIWHTKDKDGNSKRLYMGEVKNILRQSQLNLLKVIRDEVEKLELMSDENETMWINYDQFLNLLDIK